MATQSTRRAGAKRNGRAAGKWRSWETTEGVIRAPHRSMMRAMGMSDADIDAPFVGRGVYAQRGDSMQRRNQAVGG